MSSSNVLANRDINAFAPNTAQEQGQKGDIKSMDYHRQVLKERMDAQEGKEKNYISPSDTIMSPCTAKLSAYRSKHVMKAKPKSLFAKTSSKNLGPVGLFGEKTGDAANKQ